jgi:hypothetical protein
MPDLYHWQASRSSGPRSAPYRVTAGRFRRGKGAAVTAAVLAALAVVGCTPSGDQSESPAAQVTSTMTSVPSLPASSASPSSTSAPPATTAPPRTTPAVQKVTVPALIGMTVGRAKTSLARRHLRWRITSRRTTQYAPGTVASQSRPAGTPVLPATVIALVIAQAQPPPPPPADCDPAYPDVCLGDGIGDYDCAAGSGNGPNYVEGPIAVRPPDPFDLDRDGDGVGCENG